MDKIDRFLEVIEHPDRYTPNEIEAMLQDPDIKDLFDLLDKTKSSLQTIDTPDIEDEWTKLENTHRQSKKSQRPWLPRFFSRNAAASIVVFIASFTAVAAFVGVGIYSLSNSIKETVPEVKTTILTDNAASQPDMISSDELVDEKSPETVVFDNETLENIITRICSYYDYSVIFKNDSSKSLRLYFRWDQTLPIEDIVGSLNNFEQINLTIGDKTINID